MQTSTTYTARYNIPVHYKCSKCNSIVHGVIPFDETRMESAHGLLTESSKQTLHDRAKRGAYELLIHEIELAYRDGTIHYAHLINSKCPQCGYNEPWQNKESENLINKLIETLFPFFFLIFAFVNSLRIGFDSSLLFVVPLIILHFVGYFGVIILLSKIPNKKKQSKFKNIPSECVPQYSLPVEYAVANVMCSSNIPDFVEKGTAKIHSNNEHVN